MVVVVESSCRTEDREWIAMAYVGRRGFMVTGRAGGMVCWCSRVALAGLALSLTLSAIGTGDVLYFCLTVQ